MKAKLALKIDGIWSGLQKYKLLAYYRASVTANVQVFWLLFCGKNGSEVIIKGLDLISVLLVNISPLAAWMGGMHCP